MPKIQARKIRELLHINGNTLDDFLRTLSFKMDVEEYIYEVVEKEEDHLAIVVTRCPWFDILQRTKREALAPELGEAICPADLQGIASEFDVNIHFFREAKMCEYDEQCKLIFALGKTS